MRPPRDTYPDYYENYIPLIRQDNVLAALNDNWRDLHAGLSHIPAAKENYAYAEGKWTVKQVIQHMIDTERIVSYRALRFARKDPQQPLPFDENLYAVTANLDNRNCGDLLREFGTVRQATVSLFETFPESALNAMGDTSFGRTSVLALGYLIPGHALHHLNVLRQRYL
jgi:hypothetical protein